MSIRGHHLIGHKFICICLHYLIISIYPYFKKIILLTSEYILYKNTPFSYLLIFLAPKATVRTVSTRSLICMFQLRICSFGLI